MRVLARIPLIVAAAGLCASAGYAADAHPAVFPPVVICGAFPCLNSQEITTFDHNGAPIFSVGEYGGAKVYGDNLGVWKDVYTPGIVLSLANPAGRCRAPELWVTPRALWTCNTAGVWVWHAI